MKNNLINRWITVRLILLAIVLFTLAYEPRKASGHLDSNQHNLSSSTLQSLFDQRSEAQFEAVESDNVYTYFDVEPVWTTGILSDNVGLSRIVVTDLTQDGITEIITCSNGYAYALNRNLAGSYETIWYSQQINCKKIIASDRDGDENQEIFVATSDGKVKVFEGENFKLIDEYILPGGFVANDIGVADVDGDNVQELVLVRDVDALVVNAITFNLEWQAIGFGGKQVAMGNIDDEPQLEIIINGNPAHVLDANSKIQEWGYSGGFGMSMAIGDVDGDAMAEIAYIDSWYNAYVFEGDTLSIKWQRTDLSDLDSIFVADVDDDGISEVLIGDGQWGAVWGYDGATGDTLWSIPNPEHGVSGIGVGDTDNDGIKDILWGAGLSSSGKDLLLIGDWVNQIVKWNCADLDGPFFVASGDLDNDGELEFVLATHSTNSGYSGGTINVYNAITHQMEWSTIINNSFYDISHVAVGQLDNDPALEIIVGGNNWYDTRLKVYDGVSHENEWTSAEIGDYAPTGLQIKNLDDDSVDEIIVGLKDYHILVLNGASSVIQWDSGSLGSAILDFSIGDLDGNGTFELAILTLNNIYVYETNTWNLIIQLPVTSGKQVVIANSDLENAGELLFIKEIDSSSLVLQALDGINYDALWQKEFDIKYVNDMVVSDLESDGRQEIILVGAAVPMNSASFLWIGVQDDPIFWVYKMDANWGEITGIIPVDINQDQQKELIFGSRALIQENEISVTKVEQQRVYLPLVAKPLPDLGKGINGLVTYQGESAANVFLELRYFNGQEWHTRATVYTNNDGLYNFVNMPALGVGEYYYVRYLNTNRTIDRLWTWATPLIDSYASASEIGLSTFDITDITLNSPAANANLQLPVNFEWLPRSTTPSDSYEFNLFDPTDNDPYFYSDPPLGFIGNYSLDNLPTGFILGESYAWEIWVYSPDGGYGISYEVRPVSFLNSGNISLLGEKSTLAKLKKNIFDAAVR